uniref:Uncharacterized protein n=1 Tax=Arundo donax TaxID=35708 RepID=A0A0A8ZC19_ARUDO
MLIQAPYCYHLLWPFPLNSYSQSLQPPHLHDFWSTPNLCNPKISQPCAYIQKHPCFSAGGEKSEVTHDRLLSLLYIKHKINENDDST